MLKQRKHRPPKAGGPRGPFFFVLWVAAALLILAGAAGLLYLSHGSLRFARGAQLLLCRQDEGLLASWPAVPGAEAYQVRVECAGQDAPLVDARVEGADCLLPAVTAGELKIRVQPVRARQKGADIRMGCRVSGLSVEGGRVTGVRYVQNGQESAQAADVVIMNDDLTSVVAGRRHAKKVIRIATENIVGSLAIKIAIMILSVLLPAFSVLTEFPLWIAIMGDVGVCLVAIANSMRALRCKKFTAKKVR